MKDSQGAANMHSDEELERIRKAYDLTVEQYNKGIEPFDTLPEDN